MLCQICTRSIDFCICKTGIPFDHFIFDGTYRICAECGYRSKETTIDEFYCTCEEFDDRYYGECPDCHMGNCLCMKTTK